MEKIIILLCSALLVPIGAVLYDPLNYKRGALTLTDFQRFLFGTGFAYILTILWQQMKFFFDYYVKGSALQKYNSSPSENDIFYLLFGAGKSGEAQFPVWNIDTELICCVVGAGLGGAALLIFCFFRNKRSNTEQNGLFYGMIKKTPPFKQYIKNEILEFKKQVTPVEYLGWWVLRGLLLIFAVKNLMADVHSAASLQLSVNLAVTFLIPVVRAVFFKKLFFGNVSFRTQTYIDIIVFFGNFLGIGLGYTGSIENYDKFVHVISGVVAVLIGFTLIEGLRNASGLPKTAKAAASFGFSCVVMALWEIFEFLADFFMENSSNQNWGYNPKADMLFYKIFGYGAQNAGQNAVLDTNIDILCAFVGSAVAAVGIFVVLAVKEKHSVVKNRVYLGV